MSRKLYEILTYKRPAGSKTEEQMIEEFIDVLPNAWPDEYGNRFVLIGDNPTTMFSCHTDTVHHTEGKQKVQFDTQSQEMFVNHGECLGADDGAGIILMINMIEAEVPGLYVFHREEEIGGKGSAFIEKQTPWILEGVERCVAFDRMGVDSVITHQGGERCCSAEFAEALCEALGGGFWFPDPTGSFTDSANYTGIIPECTNLSIGYYSEHTKNETLSLRFLEQMIDVCIGLDWDSLPTVRDPSVVEWDDDYWNKYSYNGAYGHQMKDYTYDDIDGTSTYEEVLDYIYENPEDAAEMLQGFLWAGNKDKKRVS